MTAAEREAYARILTAIDVPECGCPRVIPCPCEGPCDCPVWPAPPCKHLLKAVHTLTIDEWAELLAGVYPADYADPPTPAQPALVLSREARVELMRQRHDGGLGLRHPGDLDQEQADCVGLGVIVLRNGRPVQTDIRALGKVA